MTKTNIEKAENNAKNEELAKSLKAKAYDCLVNIEYWQNILKKVNEDLKELMK